MRNYTLTTPYSKGPEIATAQRILGVPVDGELGPVTMSAIVAWKREFGYPKRYLVPVFNASDFAYLTGRKRQTPAMKLRALNRRRRAAKSATVPQRALAVMREWADLRTYETRHNFVPRVSQWLRDRGAPRYIWQMGYPWCAASAVGAALPSSKTARDGIVRGKFNALYVPEIYALAQRGQYGMRVVPFGQEQPGDWVIFNFDGGVVDHIGMLVRRLDGDTWHTVEGNTSAGALGSQNNGDGVYERRRGRSVITAFVRYI